MLRGWLLLGSELANEVSDLIIRVIHWWIHNVIKSFEGGRWLGMGLIKGIYHWGCMLGPGFSLPISLLPTCHEPSICLPPMSCATPFLSWSLASPQQRSQEVMDWDLWTVSQANLSSFWAVYTRYVIIAIQCNQHTYFLSFSLPLPILPSFHSFLSFISFQKSKNSDDYSLGNKDWWRRWRLVKLCG